jgi:hypothetical protein
MVSVKNKVHTIKNLRISATIKYLGMLRRNLDCLNKVLRTTNTAHLKLQISESVRPSTDSCPVND